MLELPTLPSPHSGRWSWGIVSDEEHFESFLELSCLQLLLFELLLELPHLVLLGFQQLLDCQALKTLWLFNRRGRYSPWILIIWISNVSLPNISIWVSSLVILMILIPRGTTNWLVIEKRSFFVLLLSYTLSCV